MKKGLLLLCLLLTVSTYGYATDYTQDANCQGAWLMKLDEDPLTDSSGNGNAGVLKGAGEPNFTTDAPTGYTAGSYDFDGLDDTIDCQSDFIGVTDITFTAWIRMDTLGESNGGRIINNNQFMIFNRSGGTLRSRSEPLNETSSITPPALGTWFHLALTRKSGTDGLTTWYIDGVQEGAADRDSGDPVSGDNVIIGAQTAGGALAYEGTMTEVAVFDRILSVAEINEIKDYGLTGVKYSALLMDEEG